MEAIKAFHEQVKTGQLDGVREALAANPDLLNATNEAGQTAFLLAKYYRQSAVADYLLSLKPQLDLFNLCVAGDVPAVVAEVRAVPGQLESHSSDGWTPLHLAAFFTHHDLASALIAEGTPIDIRSTNAMTNTPLHAAAAGGNTEMVELLLKNGANANALQRGGWTALHGAAQSGNRPMAEVLIAHGADLNVRAENNQTPLDMALLKGHHSLVELLETLGAKLQ